MTTLPGTIEPVWFVEATYAPDAAETRGAFRAEHPITGDEVVTKRSADAEMGVTRFEIVDADRSDIAARPVEGRRWRRRWRNHRNRRDVGGPAGRGEGQERRSGQENLLHRE